MTHHIIPGSQIDPSQARPHKTHAQHQEDAYAEIRDDGPCLAVQGAAIDGNGRGMAGRAMVGTIIDDVLALFSACGFEVRTDNPRFAILGSTDSAGILVDSVIEHFACKAVTQFTVHDIMASMPAPAAARTSVENVQDVLAALDHLEVVRMAAAGVERRRAAPAPAEGDAAGRCRAQGGDTSDEEALFSDGEILAAMSYSMAQPPKEVPVGWRKFTRIIESRVAARLAATTQSSTAQAESGEMEELRSKVQQLETMLEDRVERKPNNEQEWAKVDGAVAFHLIERHADNWNDAGNMMESWARTRSATSSTDAQAAAEVRDAWISVDERLPAVGELVLVYSPPTKHDHPGEVNIGFDCIDPNDDDHASWLSHNEHYEHFCCVAKPEGSIGPSADAPYTHWMPLPEAPAIRSAGDTGGAQ